MAKKKKKVKKGVGSEPITPESSKGKKGKTPMIAKHRFDDVNTQLKELKKWKSDKEAADVKAEEAKLKKDKKYEELADKRKVRAEKAEAKLKEAQINNKITAEATKKGIKDIDAALKLIDKGKIEVGDDGEITGVDEAVDGLLETKPYLKDAEAEPSLGSGANPPGSSSKPTITKFKLSQIQDAKFFKKHEEEIGKAMAIPGAIIDDVTPAQPGTPPATEPPSSGQ